MGRIALVFVHGFLSSVKVWSAFTELIEADSELRAGFDVRPFEYASPLATWGWRRIPDVDVVAVKLGTFLAIDLAKQNRIVLVAHSQGGLVVQSCLHSMLSDGQGLNLARVRLIVLFACPNDGSQFLSPLRWVTRFLLRNPQEKGLLPLDARITDARLRPLTPVPSAATLTGIDAHRSIFGINGSEIVGVQFSDRDT